MKPAIFLLKFGVLAIFKTVEALKPFKTLEALKGLIREYFGEAAFDIQDSSFEGVFTINLPRLSIEARTGKRIAFVKELSSLHRGFRYQRFCHLQLHLNLHLRRFQ